MVRYRRYREHMGFIIETTGALLQANARGFIIESAGALLSRVRGLYYRECGGFIIVGIWTARDFFDSDHGYNPNPKRFTHGDDAYSFASKHYNTCCI